MQAARDYSAALLNNNAFTHNLNGTNPQTRMQAAGYQFTGSWTWAENLAFTGSTGPLPISQNEANRHHQNLFIDAKVAGRGHRLGILIDNAKEIGIGLAAKPNYDPPPAGGTRFNGVISTFDFAASGAPGSDRPFLTGVVYADSATDNNFYDVGEGLAGVTVTATPVGGGLAYSATTFPSGGYSLGVPPGAYHVEFSGGALPASRRYANVAVGSRNVKLDATTDLGIWNLDGNGNWAAASNWSGIVPNGVGHAAYFGGAIASPRTVSLQADASIGALSLNSAAAYTLAGSPTARLLFTNPAERARLIVDRGSHTISAGVLLQRPLDVTVLNPTDTLSITGSIDSANDAFELVKFGRGTLRLANANPFRSGVFVNDGTLVVGANRALGTRRTLLGWGSNDVTLLSDTPQVISNNIEVATGAGGRTVGASHVTGETLLTGRLDVGRNLDLTVASGGTLVVAGVADYSPGVLLAKTGGGNARLSSPQAWSSLRRVQVSAGQLGFQAADGLVDLSELQIAAGASLDLADNDLLLSYSGPSPLQSLLGQIINGLGGIVDQPQIVSSHTVTLSAPGDPLIALHVPVDNSLVQASEWKGKPLVGFNQIIAKYTYFGDLNLDGVVDASDYLVIDGNFGQSTTGGPYFGDANLDGLVDAIDYLSIDNAFGFGGGGASPPLSVDNITPVPEPNSLIYGALGLAAGLFIIHWQKRDPRFASQAAGRS